jgi:CBS domain-containing membrane protein
MEREGSALPEDVMHRLLVRDLMTENPQTLGPDDDVESLYDLMDSRHVRHVPIVDEVGDLVGLVSHRDLFRCALNDKADLPLSMQKEMLETMAINEIMTSSIETVEPDTDIAEAAQIMIENKYGCLPVVDGKELVGILTESDFVRFVAEGLKEANNRRAAS